MQKRNKLKKRNLDAYDQMLNTPNPHKTNQRPTESEKAQYAKC